MLIRPSRPFLLSAVLVVLASSPAFGQTAPEPQAATLQRLMDAAADGPVPVIVRLRVAYQPEHLLTAQNASAQRTAIAAAQTRVASRLARATDRSVKRYPLLPAMALTVNRAV